MLIMIDSPRNCLIRFVRAAPNTLRMPTSFARFVAIAVVRFMKLIQAMNRIKMAMAAYI